MSRLNLNQINFYKKNGYLHVKNLFVKKDLKKLNEYIEEIKYFKEVKGRHMIYFDKINNNDVLTRTENFLQYHKKIKKLLNKNKISLLVDQLLKNKSILFKDKINWKYPKANGFEPHQDAQVWEYLYPKIKSFISLAISVSKTNKKNGCLEVVKGKHFEGLLGNNKSAIDKKTVKQMKWDSIYTKPGDLIFFDSYTPHRSGKNLSSKPRVMIYLTYNAKKDGNLKKEYFVNKRKSFPPNIERKKGKKYKYLI